MRRFLIAFLFLCAAVPLKAQTVQLPPWTHQQFFAQNGTPLIGGCVFTYQAGTTTPVASYTDSTGTTPNSDPIILDAGGFANIWLTSGVAYKFSVYSTGGTNCNQGTLQWTVDGITSSSASGGSSATSLTSASSNPASAGVIRLAKGDQFCWRNAGNSANLCLSLDANNNLTWGGFSLALTEAPCPTGIASEDLICADNTAHRLKMLNNGGSVDVVVGAATTDTFTNKTLTSPTITNPSTTGTDSGTETLANKTLTSPTISAAVVNGMTWNGGPNQINDGLTSGTGLQHVRFTCAGGPATTYSCTGNSWNATWADTSYTVICSAVNTSGAGNQSSVAVPSNKTTTTIDIEIIVVGASTTSSQEVDCVGIHD